jgi:hypothetical protein
MEKYLIISSYIWKPFLIYDFATAVLHFFIFEENLIFFFISAEYTVQSDRLSVQSAEFARAVTSFAKRN